MNDVEIQDTEIEHSIVLEGSSLRDLANRVTDSLIGKNVRIYRVPVKPSALPLHARRQLRGRHPVVNVLVTGGAGFIGSNFVRYALRHARGLARRRRSTS